MRVVFDRCRWTTVAQGATALIAPIYLGTTEGSYSSPVFGVEFLNCLVDDDLAREPLSINDGPGNAGEVHADILGRLAIHNPNAVPLVASVLPNLNIFYLP